MSDTTNSNIPLWEELLDLISTGVNHPDETNWAIYRYLRHNYKTMGSVMARTLLSAYVKLHTHRPSLVNSCMLGMALKISEQYSDFRFPRFLEVWGYDECLRPEDRQWKTGKDGRMYQALRERVDHALQSYKLRHPEEGRDGCADILSMYATAIFEKASNGKRRHFVKLVAPDGIGLIAESHQFPCRPYEIKGRMFDVLMCMSRLGGKRASGIVASLRKVEEVFSMEVGYVDGIDESHGHIHVYDSKSRHFVADTIAMPAPLRGNVAKGCFVQFCPIISQGNRFKSAAIVGVIDKYKGREAFGVYTARVMYVDQKDCFLRYSIEQDMPTTPEGVLTKDGFVSMNRLPKELRRNVGIGQYLHLILFLKRGKDGVKRNYVAELF